MHRARIKLPANYSEEEVEKLSGAFEDLSSAHVALREDHNDSNPWILEWIFETKPYIKELTERINLVASAHNFGYFSEATLQWNIEDIPDIDWLEHSYKQFPPFSVGPFFIYGSHFDGGAPKDQIGLQIDAATAFGSGEHETTKGCLQAMLDLKEQGVCPWHILDMGTGSGILAVAAWKLWKTPILAVDNDAESVRVAKHHQDLNEVSDAESGMRCAEGSGFAAPVAVKKKPYELIIANILAGPLIEMSIDIEPLIDENGYVILSGILNTQADDVLSAYEAMDLALAKRYELGEWTTLVLHNAAA